MVRYTKHFVCFAANFVTDDQALYEMLDRNDLKALAEEAFHKEEALKDLTKTVAKAWKAVKDGGGSPAVPEQVCATRLHHVGAALCNRTAATEDGWCCQKLNCPSGVSVLLHVFRAPSSMCNAISQARASSAVLTGVCLKAKFYFDPDFHATAGAQTIPILGIGLANNNFHHEPKNMYI